MLADLQWLVVERAFTIPRTQENLERDYLENHCERSLKLCDWSSNQVSLFLLTEEAEVVNIQSCGMHWYLSYKTKYTDTEPEAIPNQLPLKFQGRLAFWFTYIGELKIKYFLKILFLSNTDIHRFLWLYSLIACLQINRKYVTSFWFHSKLVMEKAKKPASYELAIHTVFYKYFT